MRAEALARLDGAMVADRARLRGLLDRALRRGEVDQRAFEEFEGELARSVSLRERRAASVPVVVFPDELPIAQRREEIEKAIRDHQVVVVCGETGSGKSTQLPKMALALGRGVGGMIGVTQPRRIAARAIANRVAEELGQRLGDAVGFKVRFGDKTSPQTLIKVMTDGILLAEMQSDRLLERYDTIVIDEAHERSLNIDFILGYLRHLLPKRPDLKVIVTSATIDPQRFAEHFGTGRDEERVPAPVIEVSGRTYSVEVRYRAPVSATGDDADEDEPDIQEAILGAVDELATEPDGADGTAGDILVFLSGEREIRQTAESLRKHHPPSTEIVPLYARLSTEEQNRIFRPHSGRRIVLATNIAETSLTVPGIRFVVDPGFARISRYSPKTKVQRLPIEPVSRASADQRSGRCGRVEAGVAIRLYSEEDFERRPRFTDPEILRTNLASVILQMRALRLGRIEDFPFLDKPDPRTIRDAYETLLELGALDGHGGNAKLTPVGQSLARLPIDPRIGRMVLAAAEEGCLDEVLIIASALSVQDPRDRPSDKADEADAAQEVFKDEHSDFVSFLKLWEQYHESAKHLSHSKLRAWCRDRFISYVRMREWHDVHNQLATIAGEMGLKRQSQQSAERARRKRHEPEPEPGEDLRPRSGAIHRALLTGLLSNVMKLHDRFEYAGPHGGKCSIWPGSGLFKQTPKWIVAAELVQTGRLYARTVAKVYPGWIERAGAHLVKRAWAEPHWEERTAQVWAWERVSLMGLEVVPRRHRHYGSEDPVASRQIFIQRALVEGRYWTTAPYYKHNRALIEEVEGLQDRFRRHDLIASMEAQFDFYDRVLPKDVFSGSAFENWLRHELPRNPRALCMTRADLLPKGVPGANPDDFPDTLEASGAALPLEYRYRPGEAGDGVTVVAPINLLDHLRPERCEWVVPGHVKEKAVALMRTLPKPVRRLLVPAPDYAEKALGQMRFGRGSLRAALAAELGRLAGTAVSPGDMREDELPEYLRLNIRVTETGEQTVLAEGRDLATIRRTLAPRLTHAIAAPDLAEWNRDGVTDWDFGELPEAVTTGEIVVHPAVVESADGKSVSLRAMASKERAEFVTRWGVRRLFMIEAGEEIRFLFRNLPGFDRVALMYGPLGTTKQLEDGLIALVCERAFVGGQAVPRTREQFAARLDAGWHTLGASADEALALARSVLEQRQALAMEVEGAPALAAGAVRDVAGQMKELIGQRFLERTALERLAHYPRYLAAAVARLKRLSAKSAARDAEHAALLARYRALYEERRRKHEAEGVVDPALERFRWLVEELRVSLFAQELGTTEPVSERRLEAAWAQVRS